jgi:hypothetical protein
MAHTPLSDIEGALRVTVFSEGEALADTRRLVSITVTREIDRVPTARLVVADGDLPTQTFPASDGDDFEPGAAIRINAGYGDDEATIFEGIVVGQALRFEGSAECRLVVDCQDRAVAMTTARRHAGYVDTTDGDIIRTLLSAHALAADVESTGVCHAQLVQSGCSDWDFMRARAAANGLRVIVTDGKVTVKAPDVDATPVLEVGYGDDLMAFQAELDAPWAGAPPAGSPRQGAGLARTCGTLRFQGCARAVVGGVIDVKGVGLRFSGKVFVHGLTHRIEDGTWSTEVQFGLAAAARAERDDAPMRLPSVAGLQVGVVMRLDGDPGGEFRVQVSVPAMPPGSEGLWARLLQFQGSSGSGAFFVPEVGDDVVLGCFDHDPSQPVILGSLYSRQRPPAYALGAGNDIKALVTRCRSKIEFDEAARRITVTTPGNNRIVLSDADQGIVLHDQNDNRVVLDAGGITLASPRDITLSAQGTITLDAVDAIGIVSRADVRTAGLNVRSEAQASLVARGNASAELSAAGQAVVKGAIVMIN